MNFLTKLFSRKQDSFQREGIIVKTAFTIGGIEYYELDSIYNLPYERGKMATKAYNELRNKCDDEYLKGHCMAIDNLKKGKGIGYAEITKIFELNDRMKERVFNIIDTDIIYKVASVVFFDKNESPFEYDFDYAKKKIEHWKRHKSVNDFFLQEPMQRLIPFLKLPGVNFQTYSEAITAINKVDWEFLFSLLTEKQRKDLSSVKDFYVKETSPELVN